MILESRTVLSIVSLVVLFTSFVASFKHKNGLIFIAGLVASVLINNCDNIAPFVRSKFTAEATTEANAESEAESKNTMSGNDEKKTVPLMYDAAGEDDEVYLGSALRTAPADMLSRKDELISESAKRAMYDKNDPFVDYATQRKVYGYGRPTIEEVRSGQRSAGELVPNFNTFAHVLAGHLRSPSDPETKVEAAAVQNPELLKLVPKENPGGLVAAKDYYANCKNKATAGRTVTPDERDAAQCFVRTGMY
jgi:hypothetical protein